jgi:hypothetical protein
MFQQDLRGQWPETLGGESPGVEAIPYVQPLTDLRLPERFKPDDDHSWRRLGPVGNGSAACDQDGDRDRPVKRCFAILEAHDLVQVVSLADTGRLEQFIEPVEQHDRQRSRRPGPGPARPGSHRLQI